MGNETLFWNVDTQYDFMRPDGKLYVPEAEKIEPNLERITQIASSLEIKVVNTADWHNQYSKEISSDPDFEKTFPEHCMECTSGAEYIPATRPENPYVIEWDRKGFDIGEILHKRNIVIHKDKFDVFQGNLNTDSLVELLKPEKVFVYGVATNVCVNDAVMGLLKRNVQVYVPIDAIKELPGIPLPYDAWQKKGAVLIATHEVYRIVEGER